MKGKEEEKEGLDSAVIQFTILAEAFFSLCGHGGDRRSQQALHEDTGWPQPDTEATWSEREKEKETELKEGEVSGGRQAEL